MSFVLDIPGGSRYRRAGLIDRDVDRRRRAPSRRCPGSAELELGRGDGRYHRLFRALVRVDLLILDDWGPERLTAEQRRDLLEIVEDRYANAATLITSQLPIDSWHEIVGEPTFADAILDRIIHNAYRLELQGESMRKLMATEPAEAPLDQNTGK